MKATFETIVITYKDKICMGCGSSSILFTKPEMYCAKCWLKWHEESRARKKHYLIASEFEYLYKKDKVLAEEIASKSNIGMRKAQGIIRKFLGNFLFLAIQIRTMNISPQKQRYMLGLLFNDTNRKLNEAPFSPTQKEYIKDKIANIYHKQLYLTDKKNDQLPSM